MGRLCLWELCEGNLQRRLHGWGTPKDVLSKALERASVFIGAPLLGNMEGHSFLRAFEIKIYIKRDVKCPVSGYLHSGPVGEPGRNSLSGTF